MRLERLLTTVVLVMALTLTLIIALSMALQGAVSAAPVFSGNVPMDFTAGDVVIMPDPGGIDVGVPLSAPLGTISGWDVRDVYFDYDFDTDIMYVGIDCYGICGDADGDGDPGSTSAWLTALGGVDQPDLDNTESVALRFDTDDGCGSGADFEIVAGVDAYNDISAFGVYSYTGNPVPAFGFGALLGNAVTNTNPISGAPDLEFSIADFSTLPGFTFTPGENFMFGTNLFLGSFQDAGLGEDYVPSAFGCVVVTITAPIEIQKTVYLGHNNGASCSGSNVVYGENGDAVTYCFEVTNTSDDPSIYLDDISIVDPALGITQTDLVTLSGSLPLAAGDSLVYYYEATISGSLVNTATAIGNPTDSSGNDLPGLPDPVDDDQAEVIECAPGIEIQKTVYAGHDSGDSCAGGELVTGGYGEAVTFCFAVTNIGDTYLDSITITDTVLGISLGDITWLTGTVPLSPTASLMYYYQTTIGGSITNTAETQGNPTDSGGTDIPGLSNPADDDTAAVICLATLGDRVWHDINGNGIEEGGGETGVENVTVNLYDPGADGQPGGGDDTLVLATTTNVRGYYSFTIAPGDYFVEFVPPAGYMFGLQDQGSDDSVDSDADPLTGWTDVINLTSCEVNLTWDAGIYRPADVWVLKDDNPDPVAAGTPLTYTLTVHNDGPGEAVDVVVSDTLPAEVSFVSAIPPQDGGPNPLIWNLGTMALGDTRVLTVMVNVQSWVTQTFTNTVVVTSPTPDPDPDNNDDDEPTDLDISAGLSVTKRLLTADPVLVGEPVQFQIVVENTGNVILTTVPLTDSYSITYLTYAGANPASDDNLNDGIIHWTNIGPIAAGSRVTVTVNFIAAASTQALPGGVTTNGAEASATAGNGDHLPPESDNATVSIVDQPPSILVTKTADPTSLPEPGGTFTFSVRVDNTSATDVVSITSLVDNIHGNLNGQGDCSVPQTIPAGDFYECVFSATVAGNAGYSETDTVTASGTDDDGNPVSDDDDATVTITDVLPSIVVTKTADPTSLPEPGGTVTFSVRVDNTSVEELTLTALNDDIHGDLDGQGTCTVPQTIAVGGFYQCSFTATVTGNTGDSETDIVTASGVDDDGNSVSDYDDATVTITDAPASLGDFVWQDLDADGIQEAGELGIENVTVNLYDPGADGQPGGGDDALLDTDITDAGGNYGFADLAPGDYFVEFEAPAGYAFSPQDQGGDGALDSDADTSTGRTMTINLESGEDDDAWDAGLYQPASIGDFVWYDTNLDGIQDVGEGGIAGVTVNLYDGAGVLTDTIPTDGNGAYNFGNLVAGDYSLEFVPPAGYEFTLQDQGSDDALDSDADPSNGLTILTTLDPGENELDWDAGLYLPDLHPASIGDTVWNDVDVDGIQDAGEDGIYAVTVNLYDVSGAWLAATATDLDGLYSFGNLAPGDYSLGFVPPAGYEFTLQDQGSDDALDSDSDPSNGLTILTTLDPGENDLAWDAGLFQYADLSVVKTDYPDPVVAGAPLTYTLMVSNAGPGDALNVVLTDTLPAEVEFVSASPVQSSGPNPLVWDLGALPAGQSQEIQILVNVRPWVTQTFTNTVVITSTTPDDDPDDNDDDEPTTPLVPGLQVVKSVTPGVAVRSMPLTYTIRITNTGEVTFDPLALTDTLPADFYYVVGSGSPSDPDTIAEPILVWQNLGPLAPGASLTVTFQVTATPGVTGTFVNWALGQGSTPGGPITDTDDIPVEIVDPALVVDKTLVAADLDLEYPNWVTFTITITNVGVSAIDVLPMLDQYDPYYLSFVWADPMPEEPQDDGFLTWYDLTGPAPNGFGANLEPGASLLITTVFSVVHDITTTVNSAIITDALDIYTNPVPPDQDDEVIIDVPTAVELLYFRAWPAGNRVILEWETVWELDNWGFNLYRSPTPDLASAEHLDFVPGQGWGQFGGHYYTYVDHSAAPGQSYYYWLEDVDLNNNTSLMGGPMMVFLPPYYTIYLPLVRN